MSTLNYIGKDPVDLTQVAIHTKYGKSLPDHRHCILLYGLKNFLFAPHYVTILGFDVLERERKEPDFLLKLPWLLCDPM
jgi:hypothetical protein